jgi:TPP-dependent pyruvate/acetoin dehydrogenase alpha subunit
LHTAVLTVIRAAPNAVRFGDGIRFTIATRRQLTTVLAKFERYAGWKIDGVGVNESDVRWLISAMDEARELNR